MALGEKPLRRGRARHARMDCPNSRSRPAAISARSARRASATTHAHLPFDQQPLEAQAAIEAARGGLACQRRSSAGCDHAQAAWHWFFGANDRGVVLADLATGRCRDGVTPRGANENCGAESILAFQLSHYSLIALAARATAAHSSGREHVRARTERSARAPCASLIRGCTPIPRASSCGRFTSAGRPRTRPGERAQKLVDDVAALSESQVVAEYAKVRSDFAERHWQTEQMFEERFGEVAANAGSRSGEVFGARASG